MQNRIVPRFLCFKCSTWQERYPTNLFDMSDNSITHLYCHNCKIWIPVKLTSLLTGEHYVIDFLQYPSIIDNDCSYPKIIFQGKNIKALSQVCRNYNICDSYTFRQACQDYREYIDHEFAPLP